MAAAVGIFYSAQIWGSTIKCAKVVRYSGTSGTPKGKIHDEKEIKKIVNT
jgi:hypothetical protein